MAETGKKMGDYTPLESNKKAYFFGDGEGGVVAVGKTEAGGKKTNRLVKLSDIAGDTEWSVTRNTSGNTPDIGINVGMAYDINIGGTSKLVNMYDSNVKAGYDPSAGGTSIEPPLHLGQLWFDDHSGHQENPDVYVATGTSANSQWKLLHKGGGTTGQVLTKTATGEAWADAPKELPATTSADAGKALHVGSDGAPVFKFAELRQMPDVVQQSASDNGHIFTNNTYTKVILKYNTDQDLYSPQVKLASDELLNCIIDIYIDSTYSLDGHDLFIMFDIQRNGGSLKQIARPLTGDHFKHLEKGSYVRVYALGDSWSAQVGIPWNTPGWLPCQLVPPAEAGDNGKMLQVLDTNGTLGWGVGIPAPANGDVGKVLTASTSEGHLVAAWESASGGGGGSGGRTKVSIDVSNSEYVSISGNTYNITIPANNSYVMLSNLPDSYEKDLDFILPSVAETEVVDVVIEGCGRARNDVYVKNSQGQYLHKICEDDTGGKSNIEIDTYFQVLVLGEYSYRFFVERPLS